MNKALLSTLFSAGLILGGCSLAPEYSRPEAPVPAQWPNSAAYGKDSAEAQPAADIKWRDFLRDERLIKVIEQALSNNRDLRLAALNVERAQGMYGIQRGALYPSIDANGGRTHQRRSADLVDPGQPKVVEQYSANLGLVTWELDFFGRVRSLSDQALEEYFATDEARRGTQIALVAEVARVYLTLAADRENLALARSTTESQQTSYALVKKRFDIGLASELDLKRAQLPLDTARGELARYTQLVAQDQNALNLLAGSPVPEEWLPVNLSNVTPLKEATPGTASETLLRRPDIMAAEHRLKGAYASIGAARASLFPRISLTASAGTASTELSHLFDATTKTWLFSPQFSMPIFDTRLWAALRVSKTDRESLLTQYEKTIQTAFREVADVLAVRGTIDDRLVAQQSFTNAVADAYRLADQRYNKGIDSYLSVLDAQRTHFAAQQGLVALRLAKLTNQVQLYSVFGGGTD